MIRLSECRRHPITTVVMVVTFFVVVAVVVLLAANPAEPASRVPAWLPGALVPARDNTLPALLLIGALPLHLAAVSRLRQGRSISLESAIVWSVLITVILGTVSYHRCLQGESPLSVAVWVTGLFSSEVETAVIGPGAPDGVCRGPYPLTFQVARLFGSAALVLGALAVFLRLLRPTVDRFRVRWAGDVDVVVGLTPATLPLIEALVDDDRRRHDAPRWFRRTLGDGWRWFVRLVLRARRTWVVVVHANPADPLVAEARASGAIVYLADPTSELVLRRVVLTRLGRVTVRRFFAVTDSQSVNIAIVSTVRDLVEPRPTQGRRPAVVPRLVAGFADPREARDWRLDQFGTQGCFVDAINVEALLARELVDRAVTAGVRHLLVVGDHPLAVALLDEVAQQRAFQHELDHAGGARPVQPGFALESVVLIGERSDEVRREWWAHRTPASEIPRTLPVESVDQPWEEVAAARAATTTDPLALVITGPPADDVNRRALRLHRAHRHLIVIRPSDHVHGVQPPASAPPSILRYGPSLTEADGVPEDTWTALARQQHRVYIREQPWATPGLGPTAARRPWPRGPFAGSDLPDFFREDNLRQQRRLLQGLATRGYRWREVTAGAPRQPPANLHLIEAARDEHFRWCDVRLSSGWRSGRPWTAHVRTPMLRLWQRLTGRPATPPVPPKATSGVGAKAVGKLLDEQWRANGMLVEWQSGEPLRRHGRQAAADLVRPPTQNAAELQDWNIWTLNILLRRLHRHGIAPEYSAGEFGPQAFRRRGVVKAVQRSQAWEWRTADGAVLRSDAGDWWVEDDHGGRGVAAGEFERTHEALDNPSPLDRPGRYRRIGQVVAECIAEPTVVKTAEGPVDATPGMWLVTRAAEDAEGRPVTLQWPVSDEVFFDGYLPALPDPDQRDTGAPSPGA